MLKNFKEIGNKVVEGYALVRSCDVKASKNGSYYLDLVIGDNETEMVAKKWDFSELEMEAPESGTLIKVRGNVQQYNGADQLVCSKIRPVVEEDAVDINDFVKSSEFAGTDLYDTLMGIVASFKDDELRNLVECIYAENKEILLTVPAAEKMHHAMRGGLLYHTLSIVRMAESTCRVYKCLDKELLITGAILHDIAKIKEYKLNATGLVDEYTLEGKLIGHLVMGAEYVGQKCDELGISKETKTLLQHMLISHHGKPEYGAAVRPAFIEAEVLSQLDDFDAKMYELANAMSEVEPGEFSGKLWMFDNRCMYNHGRVAEIKPQARLL